MKHFLSLLILLCADLKADFLDKMAKTIIVQKQTYKFLQDLEKKVKSAHKEVLNFQKKSSTDKVNKNIKNQLTNLYAKENRLSKNFENIKNKLKDPKTSQEIKNNLQEIVELNKKFRRLKLKIKKNTKPNSEITNVAQAYCDEINSITASLAAKKAKVKDILCIV